MTKKAGPPVPAIMPFESRSQDIWVSGRGSSRSNHARVSDWREGRQGKTAELQLFEPAPFRRLESGDQVIRMFGWW